MNSAIYLSSAALEQLERAQAEIDEHISFGIDGRCLMCGELAQCKALQRASGTFASYGTLPLRRAGRAIRGIVCRRSGHALIPRA